MAEYQSKFKDHACCIIMATYNNATTVGQMVEDILTYGGDLIVVNDGSSDNTLEVLAKFKEQIILISYAENKGKGWALRQGFKKARQKGFRNAISIDSDGQHFASDIPKYLEVLDNKDHAVLILGNRNMNQDGIPTKSSFGNRFSNFWYWVETGKKQADTQTGYRLYPISEYDNMHFYTNKFEFEIEILIRSAWREIEIESIDIQIKYFQGEDRISHFRPFKDFFRISILNTALTTIALAYIKPRDLYYYFKRNSLKKIIHEQLTIHNESPEKLSFTLGFGVFMGIVPIWGFQMITAVFLCQLMHLNKTLTLLASNVSFPPLIPFIIIGSYWTGGLLLGNTDLQPIIDNFKLIGSGNYHLFIQSMGQNFYQYIIGAFILATVAGLSTFLVAYGILRLKYKLIKAKP